MLQAEAGTRIRIHLLCTVFDAAVFIAQLDRRGPQVWHRARKIISNSVDEHGVVATLRRSQLVVQEYQILLPILLGLIGLKFAARVGVRLTTHALFERNQAILLRRCKIGASMYILILIELVVGIESGVRLSLLLHLCILIAQIVDGVFGDAR